MKKPTKPVPKMSGATMPPGEYFVGDLYYALTDEEWSDICEAGIVEDTIPNRGGVYEIVSPDTGETIRFALYRTCHGDGTFEDNEGNSYDVDLGGIGCILRSKARGHNIAGGAIVTFDDEFSTGYDAGVIQIGRILIQTDDEL